MKIAFTSKGPGWNSKVDPRFGRTEYLLIYDTGSEQLISFDNRNIENEAHGAGPKTAKLIYDNAVNVIITGNGPGENAAIALEKAGVKIFTGAGRMTVREALEAFNNNKLNDFK